MSLNTLGLGLLDRFHRTGSVVDLEDSIRLLTQAVQLTPRQDDPNRARFLSNLGVSFSARYHRTGVMADLDESLRLKREVLDSGPGDSRNRPSYLTNLGCGLLSRFSSTGALDDLEDAIRLIREALATAPEDYAERASCLISLGNALRRRFLRGGLMADLDEALRVRHEALDMTPPGHPDRASMLNDLSNDLRDRFNRTGTMMDLEEAIRSVQEALAMTSEENPDRAIYLNTLGNELRSRFRRHDTAEDLAQAICVRREALNATPQDHPQRATYLNSLGITLHDRFRRIEVEALAGTEEATRLEREAADATLRGQNDRAHQLNQWAIQLRDRSRQIKAMAMTDLADAICAGREAVDATPMDHPDRQRFLSSLGSQLSDRLERIEAAEDLQEAMRVEQEAADATPHDHPDKAGRLNNLSARFEARFRSSNVLRDAKLAVELYTRATESLNAPPLSRICAGQNALRLSLELGDWQHARTVAEAVIKLLPRLVPRSQSREDQQHTIMNLSSFSSRAAASVLLAEGTPFEAFEVFEAGRGVIAGLVIASRNDISHLETQEPRLYSEYLALRERVSAPFTVAFREGLKSGDNATSAAPISIPVRREVGLDGYATVSKGIDAVVQSHVSRAISQRHHDVNELDRMESEIRRLPGFERFLLPSTASDMIALAERGPIVSFNVTEFRSDAFLIRPSGITALRLDRLTLRDLTNNVDALVGKRKVSKGTSSTKPERQFQLQELLKWLWDVAVHPVLHELGLLSPKPSEPLPRLWWITSGHMGLTPLHAAGDSTRVTSDYVVSTYIPTLKTLQYSREKALRRPSKANSRLLVVAMPETSGMSPLKTEEEVNVIRENCMPVEPTVLINPTKSRVLEEMSTHQIIHFACHGDTNSIDPSSAGIFLGATSDEDAEHLTVRELADTVHSDAQIAFLSACSTAENSSSWLIDEVIHVASAFQLIGFPHVIGTLWETSDRAAVQIAGAFYKALREAVSEEGVRGGHDAVAYALHRAVVSLRAKKPADVLSWVPFIHVGA
ncbi:MAG: hypothetical protein M1817_003727 [Caeruleum heppii]|nr:MAG: hypothetical protein M1817_003727 [Caeruleum heppii]